MVIGIVTLSFNQARFLQEAMNSVCVAEPNQLEYIVVDPGSEDDSRQIIRQLAQRDTKMVFEPDRGPAEGLNKGFAALTRAEICGYLNADDRFTPGVLDFVCEYFDANHAVDVLLGGIFIVDSQGRRSLRARRAEKVTLSRCAEGTCGIWQQGTFFRKSALQQVTGFNEQNRTCWDAELVIDMMLAGCRIGYASRVLGEFRIHSQSITGSGSLTSSYEIQHEALVKKIYASGVVPRHRLKTLVARQLHRWNPIRHTSNLLGGLT